MLSVYVDQHVALMITTGLRERGIDVLTAHDDNHADASDADILQRATNLNRVIFTRDRDFLILGTEALKNGIEFYGIIYAHQLQATIGEVILDIELICNALEPEEMRNKIQYLPL